MDACCRRSRISIHAQGDTFSDLHSSLQLPNCVGIVPEILFVCSSKRSVRKKKLRATLFALQNRHFHLPKNNIRPNSEGIVPSNTLSETSNSTKLRALDASIEMEATNTTHSPKLLAKAAEPTCVPKRLAKAAEPSSVGNVPPSVFFRRRMVASTANA